VLVKIAGPYRAQHEMLMGVISEATGPNGWTIANCWAEVTTAHTLQEAIAWYGATAAIMLHSGLPYADWLVEAGIPSVMLRYRDRRLMCVTVDDEAIATTACDHLIATGVPHLAYLSLERNSWSLSRLSAFAKRAALGGRPVISEGSPEALGHDNPALDAWLAGLPKPCGLFCGNDHVAAEVMRACQRCGIIVPRELLVLGVDDEPALCHQGHPPLSSVAMPWEHMGREAVRLLAARLSRPSRPPTMRLIRPSGVTVRASTDILAVEDDLVRRAVHLIRDRIGSNIGTKDLIRELRCSRTVLEERFRACLGCSPFAEIRRTRLVVARRLQARGDLSVGEIARGAGFPSPASLRRALRSLG
jgi:LacI family transcriptional regulator